MLELDAMAPAEGMYTRHVQLLSRRPIGIDVIEHHVALKADNVRNQRRKCSNRNVFSSTYVDRACFLVSLHQRDRRVGQVVNVEEFPHRRARTPELHPIRTRRLGQVKLADQRR